MTAPRRAGATRTSLTGPYWIEALKHAVLIVGAVIVLLPFYHDGQLLAEIAG